MLNNSDFEPTIDKILYGMLLRRARLNLGYRRAEDFVKALKYVTGTDMSKDALYRIESGKQEPSVNFMIAINIMLGKPLMDDSMIRMCIPKEWNDLEEKGHRYDYDSMKYDVKFDSVDSLTFL